MSAFSNYLEEKLLGVTLLGSTFTAPSTIYIGLASALSTDGDTLTEIATGSYARVAAQFNAPSSGAVQNNGNIVFPQATDPWGTITHALFFDASTNGNLLYWSALETPRTIADNDTFSIPDASMTITLD